MPTSKRPPPKNKRSSRETTEAKLRRENKELKRERDEALEQQAATSEILRVIASSPADIQPVLKIVAQSAATLCDAQDAVIYRVEGHVLQRAAVCGSIPIRSMPLRINRGTTSGRAVVDRQTIHIHDIDAESETEFPDIDRMGTEAGSRARTRLAVPLLHDGVALGTILIRRMEVRPFTDKQIALLKTFADQAVIAIENVRLFQELTEALEQQTATSEILGVIASSPTDLQPVLEAVAASAARVCGAEDVIIFRVQGQVLRLAVWHGTVPLSTVVRERGVAVTRGTVVGRSVVERHSVHVHDLAAELETEFPEAKPYQQQIGFRTTLATPLLREGNAVGAIHIRRMQVQPFTEKQIKLLETFADQAVIAIENVRLFNEIQKRNEELREALEQQTATSEVLRVIASSPTELQPVLDALIANAVKLSGATKGHVRQLDGEFHRVVAHYGESPERISFLRANPLPASPDTPTGRALVERRPIHVLDVQLETGPHISLARQTGARTMLVAPLMREETPIGGIIIWRDFVDPFTERQIELVKTFADQAVIAIENVRLFNELDTRNRQLTEALEQQTATSEILGVIASSPTDLKPVLETITERAARVCGAEDAVMRLVEGNVLRLAAHYGSVPDVALERPINRQSPPARAVVDQTVIHHEDVDQLIESEYPEVVESNKRARAKTVLAVPLIREGVALGVIHFRRTEIRSFSEKQIALVKTFADQAVIAIENVRLFKELQERNGELREALEHQTATAEVLGIISRSPTDVQPVLDAIVESAARVCGIDDVVLRLRDGKSFVPRAHFGPIPINRIEISIDEPQFRWMREHGTLHVSDVRVQNEFPTLGSASGYRTLLAAPLRQQGEFIGMLNARRSSVRPFGPAQIKLLETFADQAVIAIENVRLFNELDTRNRQLTEALEQQTATSEVLKVISRSTFDLEPVLRTLVENAARLCRADIGIIFRLDGEVHRWAADFGVGPDFRDFIQRNPAPRGRASLTGRVELGRRPVHVLDALADPDYELREHQRLGGFRTMLGVPLLRGNTLAGIFFLSRREVEAFTDKQIELVTTFADQAVIAIENVRLLKELQDRNSQLSESLEQQTATSEILRVIASSPTDIQPVLDTVAESAARLCEAVDAQIWRVDGDRVRFAAQYGSIPSPRIEEGRPVIRGVAGGRAILDRETVHIPDTFAPNVQNEFPETWAMTHEVGIRTLLATPLLREGTALGYILIRRLEARPFSDNQVALLKTFADQAVIAIENVRLFQELTEALEQQTATSEILGVIASSPTDIQPVLDTVIANAVKLAGAKQGHVRQYDGEFLNLVAYYNETPEVVAALKPSRPVRESVNGRAFLERRPVQRFDAQAEYLDSESTYQSPGREAGARSALAVPLIREGAATGTILIWRDFVQPFTDRQIELVKTFADQAVIAIENVRLFKELENRNRQLTEALEQQTATSEILRVIASSPTDIQPVLDVVAENAARLCDATDAAIIRVNGASLKTMAHYGPISASSDPPFDDRSSIPARAIIDRQTIHIHDLAAVPKDELRARFARSVGVRTVLATPLLREGVAIGAILIRRTEVRPFTDKQVALLKTFADQAVIAIENVRLFRELQERTRDLMESVEELKALGEVGHAVSSSLDLETVLETIVARAVDLSGTDCGVIYEFDEAAQEFNLRASHRMEAEAVDALRATRIRAGEGAAGQAASTRAPVQIPDTFDERERSTSRIRPLLNRLGYRSLLTVPLLREQKILGGLTVWRRQAGEFDPEVVNLLQTFATQSALAIHNAQLFREIQAKGRELEAANRHKSEFLANVSHELRTPLNAIIGFSEVLLEKLFGELNDKQNEYVDDILSSGRHLLSLINDILDLSKIEAGHMELELTSFDLPTAVENALVLIKERASRHGVRLERVVDEELGDFRGDERKLKQVLVNLLSNAVKFTPEGGKIQVRAGLDNGAVKISVSDTGIGIAPEHHETIFEEFRQVGSDYARKREGTGLGLTLTKKFVEMHGGRIWVESEPGKGSTFTFILPVQ
jgi:GAF domain-containing protein/anti-sigma regulatory factor (Ser/Thr protein kinase)